MQVRAENIKISVTKQTGYLFMSTNIGLIFSVQNKASPSDNDWLKLLRTD